MYCSGAAGKRGNFPRTTMRVPVGLSGAVACMGVFEAVSIGTSGGRTWNVRFSTGC